MIKTRIIPALAAALLAVPGAALASEANVPDISFSFEGPFGTYDKHQLQRGFEVYHQVCRACHGLKYVTFRALGDETGPAFPADQVKAIAAQYDVPNPEGAPGDTQPGKPSDHFPANTSAGAPDLSLMAKARKGFSGPDGLLINQLIHGIGGPEYIHAILTGFNGKTDEVAGETFYENHYFPGGKIKMPPPLSEGLVEYHMYNPDGSEYTGAEGHGEAPPPATVDQMSEDVSAFLMWAAEPELVTRKESGFRNILFLIALTVLLYFTNKALWARVKHKE